MNNLTSPSIYNKNLYFEAQRNWITALNETGLNNVGAGEWFEVGEIVNIINHFCGDMLNHTLLPVSGGMDILGVERDFSNDGCIRLYSSEKSYYLLRPQKLEFVHVKERPIESFLKISADRLTKTDTYDNVCGRKEQLAEIEGEYYPYDIMDCGDIEELGDAYRNLDLESANCCTRILDGSLLMVSKQSIWNRSLSSYAGCHERCSTSEIENQIRSFIH